MNTEQPELAQLIDQLVDDELTREQRVELFTCLDDEIDGWRQCALAFAEAQSLRRSLGAMMRDNPTASSIAVAPPATKPQTLDRTKSTLPWWVLASCLVLALSIGVSIGYTTARTEPTAIHIGDNTTTSPDSPDTLIEPPVQPVAYASIGDGKRRSPKIRVMSGEANAMALSEQRRLPISNRDLKELERRGWKLRQDRRFVFVELNTGDELTIPIDTFRYEFVGNRVY